MRYAALVLGALAISLAVVVATGVFRPSAAAADGLPPATVAPAPSRPEAGALVLGGRAGDLAVGLEVARRNGNRFAVSATILAPSGLRASGLEVTITANGGGATPTVTCGRGCYRADGLVPRTDRISVTVNRPGKPASASFSIPPTWTRAEREMRRVTRTFRSLRSVEYLEHLDSGQGEIVDTRWRMAAPDRLAYAIEGGAQGIAIGRVRWDRPASGPWVRSTQTPLDVPEPVWGGQPENAALIGHRRLEGRPVSVVAFQAGASLPAWFTVWIDDATLRPVHLTMVTAAHFMTQRFVSFDRPVGIVPPR